MAPKRRPAQERFEQKIYYGLDGCWYWIGALNPNGYGHFAVDGNKPIFAHRASWIIYKGEIPKGLCVCHTCDVKPCVNPDHLFLGTDADNVRDKVAKGRGSCGIGSRQGKAKLIEQDVLEIRKLYSDGIFIDELAEKYQVSYNIIWYAVRRKTWRHI